MLTIQNHNMETINLHIYDFGILGKYKQLRNILKHQQSCKTIRGSLLQATVLKELFSRAAKDPERPTADSYAEENLQLKSFTRLLPCLFNSTVIKVAD